MTSAQGPYHFNFQFSAAIGIISFRKLVTPEPLTKSFATFGLGSSSQILAANWKKYPCQFQ